MLELFVLLISIIILIYMINKNIIENYDDYHLVSCPSNYNLLYKDNGDMICYVNDLGDDTVIANNCISNTQCILNGNGTADVPNCVDAIMERYKQESIKFCPPSLQNYFEGTVKGCTSGSLNNTLDGPRTTTQPLCKIYSTLDLNAKSKDSCYNRKLLDEAKCFGENCVKTIIQMRKNEPVLVEIRFTDTNRMVRSAYTRKSIINYLNILIPDWKNMKIIDLYKNPLVAEVAKEYYFG